MFCISHANTRRNIINVEVRKCVQLDKMVSPFFPTRVRQTIKIFFTAKWWTFIDFKAQRNYAHSAISSFKISKKISFFSRGVDLFDRSMISTTGDAFLLKRGAVDSRKTRECARGRQNGYERLARAYSWHEQVVQICVSGMTGRSAKYAAKQPTHPATRRNTGLKSGTESWRKILEPVRRRLRSHPRHVQKKKKKEKK